MPFFSKRLLETILPQVIISVVLVMIIDNFLPNSTRETYFILILIALVFYIILQVRNMLGYWFAFPDMETFYKTNFAAYGVLFLINMIMVVPDTGPVYTWLFLPYKLFVMAGIYKTVSAFLVHLILAAVIAVTPFLAKKIEGSR